MLLDLLIFLVVIGAAVIIILKLPTKGQDRSIDSLTKVQAREPSRWEKLTRFPPASEGPVKTLLLRVAANGQMPPAYTSVESDEWPELRKITWMTLNDNDEMVDVVYLHSIDEDYRECLQELGAGLDDLKVVVGHATTQSDMKLLCAQLRRLGIDYKSIQQAKLYDTSLVAEDLEIPLREGGRTLMDLFNRLYFCSGEIQSDQFKGEILILFRVYERLQSRLRSAREKRNE